MTDEILTAYLLDDLSPPERAAVEISSTRPVVAERLRLLGKILSTLRQPSDVVSPAGLADRTLAAIAAQIGPPTIPSTAVRPNLRDEPLFSIRRRIDFIIAAGIGFLAFGLVIAAIQKNRYESSVRSCQNVLRVLSDSLDGFSQTHGGRYPQVGVPGAATAGSFTMKLTEGGYLPPGAAVRCPALEVSNPGPNATSRVGFTYTLGYMSPGGRLIGMRRPDPILGNDDRIALAGDFPTTEVAPAGGPYSPHIQGQNILFAGGNVLFVSSAGVGIDGDDVYRNASGRIGAGLYPGDICLGRPKDYP